MPATSARARSGRGLDDATVKVTFSVGRCTTAVQVSPGQVVRPRSTAATRDVVRRLRAEARGRRAGGDHHAADVGRA